VEIVQREPNLFEVVRTLHPPGRLARGLHGREQQRHENANNRDDDQELHEREASPTFIS
jgi:hypothetical protein